MTGAFSDLYKDFGRKQYAGVPVIVVYLLVLALVVWFVLEQTPLGRRLYATGATPRRPASPACRPTGSCGARWSPRPPWPGFAGVLFSMKTGTFSTSIGPGYLFPAVAAVFFGTSQFSGRPNVWGTVVAYFALAFGIKGLQLVAGPGTVWIGPVFEGTALAAGRRPGRPAGPIRCAGPSRRRAHRRPVLQLPSPGRPPRRYPPTDAPPEKDLDMTTLDPASTRRISRP